MRFRVHSAWWLLLVIPWFAGLARIRLDTEILNLLPGEVPEVRGLRLQRLHFTDSRELLIALRAPDAERAEALARAAATALRERPDLASRADWQPSWVEHPEELAELVVRLWLNQPPSLFAELTNRLAPERLADVAVEARERLATSLSPDDLGRMGYDPFGLADVPRDSGRSPMLDRPLRGYASEDGTFRVVQVEAARALPDYRACAAWLAEVRKVVGDALSGKDGAAEATWRLTGAPAFVAEIASGMARDMQLTVAVTLVLIAALFGWAHRGWVPLGLLVSMLALVLAGTLAAGGWIFGTLNAVSLGFGAILLGLAVDCGLVVFQEAAAAPEKSAAELRRELASSVGWSAATTASAFFLLRFAGLPGLSQLGTLVGFGVLLAPCVMLF
ncbi:MAG: MMPL family transporter, partial [Verrucomicrobiales bacterium]|nr:MMPL family transporter [Verrucomicrobiales bacterium]